MSYSAKKQWQLLGALYEHGVNYKALGTAFPEGEITKERLQHFVACSRASAMRQEPPVEKGEVGCMTRWVTHTENAHILDGSHDFGRKKGRLPLHTNSSDDSPLLSKVMLYLSEEDDHPAPSSSTDPDYKQIYGYLSQLLGGEEPSQLSRGSAAKVMEMLRRVERVAKQSPHNRGINHLISTSFNAYLASGNKKTRVTRQQSRAKSQRNKSKECPLFSEPADAEQEEIRNLNKDDPYYALKKEKALKECKERQMAVISTLSSVQGLNPFNFPPPLFVKPEEATMDALQKC